jgi:HAD superfamily hydrolase (TIGR01509 family)
VVRGEGRAISNLTIRNDELTGIAAPPNDAALSVYPPMNALQALIFDVDGTIAETELDGHLTAFNHAFEKLGLPVIWGVEEYAELLRVGGGKERLAHYLDNHPLHDLRDVPEDRQELIARIHHLKTQHYRRIVDSGKLPLRTGVKRLIAEAEEAGVRIAIATTSSQEAVSALLSNTFGADFRRHFHCIAAGDVVARKKPAPDIYRYVLQQLRVDADSAVAIEDSEPGLRAALQAGLTTVVTPSGFTRDQDFSGAAAVVDQLGDPGTECRQDSGCVELVPMVTLDNLDQLLTETRRSRPHGD